MVHNDHDSGGDNEETPQAVAHVLTFALTHDSTMSSLTDSNQKRPAESLSDEIPSPVRQRKIYFQKDDDFVLSGNKSDGWEAKEDKMAGG
jgi:hypothetical protein